ncbi:MAG: diacylglycerol kinase family lipid kinase [Candidatus Heimdallarchaeota archaeon]|nr:diacylglycerol kinase family lipid kinase [Candidatus Heimdallarchaeota archaeon]
MTSYLFIVNPEARNGAIGKMWPNVEEEILKRGMRHTTIYTKEPKHAIEIAREEANNFDIIVATGGDGTVNEVANGLYGTGATFGVLPLGNGNDFARGILLDDDFQRSLDILVNCKTLDLTVGIATADDDKRYFVNIADTGVGATISVSAFTEAKWLRGFLKYYYLALKGVLKYRLVPTKIQVDDQEPSDGGLVILAAGVGHRFGAGFQILPDNYAFEPDFAICYANDIGKMDQINLLNVLKGGNHLGRKNVHYIRGSKISLELGKALPVEVEGEIVSFAATKVTFEVAPEKMKTVVPDEFIQLKESRQKK